jgi:hypothetical protein
MSNKQVGDFPSVPLAQDFTTNLQQEIEEARFTRPQFPPKITPKDLIVHKKNGDMPSRSPNAFMIYRKLFVDELHNEGHYLPMTTASSMASSSWKKEPDFVKQEYRRLASEAKSRHLKLYSNQIPCRKRNRKVRNTTQNQLTSLQIIPQYPQLTQSRSEDSTAVSSPVTSSPEMSLPEEISRVSHIPYGLTDNEPVGFYLPHQFPVTYNNNTSSGNQSGFGSFQDHANMVLYEHLIADYHQFDTYQQTSQPTELQSSVPQNFLQMPPYSYFY